MPLTDTNETIVVLQREQSSEMNVEQLFDVYEKIHVSTEISDFWLHAQIFSKSKHIVRCLVEKNVRLLELFSQ